MAPNICCYQECYTQRYPCGSITFFQLPTDEPRRSQWILNSGNKQLQDLKINQKRYICENHFKKSDIKSHSYRKILHKNAVPVPYGSEVSSTEMVLVRKIGSASRHNNNNNNNNMVRESLYVEYEAVEVEFQQAEVTSSNNTYIYDTISEDNDGKGIEENLLLSNNQSYILYNSDNEDEMGETLCTEDTLRTTEMNTSQTELTSIKPKICDLSADPVSVHPEMDSSESNSTVLCDKDCIRNIETTYAQKLEINNDNENNCDMNEYTMTSGKSHDILNKKIFQLVKNPESSRSGENCLTNIKQLQEQKQHQSYESDKHFALSLVYYFQRLDAKKNMKAKFDILSYLIALEQEDNAQLGSDKLEQETNANRC